MPLSRARPGLEALRRHIEKIERKETVEGRAPEACALGPLRVAPGALHEIRAVDWRDAPAAHGLALAMAGKIFGASAKPAVWIGEAHAVHSTGRAYACGFPSFGVSPSEFIFVFSRNAREILWAAEEAAGAAGVGAVLIEFSKPHRLLDLMATRRLQLAAENSGATPIILRRADDPTPSAARTRWRISAAPSAADIYDRKASGDPRWRIELEKCRGGGRGAWVVEWDDERGELREAALPRRLDPEMDNRPPAAAAVA